jgi:hypothetical protein
MLVREIRVVFLPSSKYLIKMLSPWPVSSAWFTCSSQQNNSRMNIESDLFFPPTFLVHLAHKHITRPATHPKHPLHHEQKVIICEVVVVDWDPSNIVPETSLHQTDETNSTNQAEHTHRLSKNNNSDAVHGPTVACTAGQPERITFSTLCFARMLTLTTVAPPTVGEKRLIVQYST